MKCPTCRAEYLRKFYSEESSIWLCPQCGTATWGDGCAVYVPAQAKEYAALRRALQQIAAPDPHSPGWRQWRARAALDAAPE